MDFNKVVFNGAIDYHFEMLHERGYSRNFLVLNDLGMEGGHASENYRFTVHNGTVTAHASATCCDGDLSNYLFPPDVRTLQTLDECLDLVKVERDKRLKELKELDELESYLRSLPLTVTEPEIDEEEDEDEEDEEEDYEYDDERARAEEGDDEDDEDDEDE